MAARPLSYDSPRHKRSGLHITDRRPSWQGEHSPIYHMADAGEDANFKAPKHNEVLTHALKSRGDAVKEVEANVHQTMVTTTDCEYTQLAW